VTCQAISRWEAGGGYPDMGLVPAIANYFHVSIDELFGYHGDREAQIQAIVDKGKSALYALGGYLSQDNRDLTDTVEMLRTALEEFPNEPDLMQLYADCLFYHGWQKKRCKPKDKRKRLLSIRRYRTKCTKCLLAGSLTGIRETA
jgi:transcriptional regulator with XRE-family HTH domain